MTGTHQVTFFWHGGEPFVQPVHYWEGIFRRQKAVFSRRRARIFVENHLQTNLTLVADKHLPFIRKYVRLGCSYDVPRYLQFYKDLYHLPQVQAALQGRVFVEPFTTIREKLKYFGEGYESPLSEQECAEEEWVLAINTNGDVYSQGDCYDPEYRYGNLFEESFETILQSEGRQKRIARSRERIHQTCRPCFLFRKGCGGAYVSHAQPSEMREYQKNIGCYRALLGKMMLEEAQGPGEAQRSKKARRTSRARSRSPLSSSIASHARGRVRVPSAERVLRARTVPAGTAHLEVDWRVNTRVWRVTSSYEAVPAGAIALAYADASIDERVDGWGTTPNALASATIARAEALERFALRRRDLARRVPDSVRLTSLAGARGLAFDYFRALSRVAASHTVCVARPEQGRGKSYTVPFDWIYFSPSPGIANSNGAAFGPTLTAAIASARREVVERDLVIRAWYGLRPSRALLERETASPRIERWRSGARDRGLDVHWFLLGDRAPGGCERSTVYCVLASPRPPYISTGSATRPDLLTAVEKAFFEAAGCHLSHLQLIADIGLRAFVRRALKRLSGDPRVMTLQHYGQYLGRAEGRA